MNIVFNRRDVLKLAGAAAAAGSFASLARAQQAGGKVVVLGAGFGGATFAQTLRRIAPAMSVTLVEQSDSYVTCPFSNTVIGGINDIAAITHSLDGIAKAGIDLVKARVEAIDADNKALKLADGSAVAYDRLVISPGIDFKWGAIEGYDEAAAQIMPHAWKAGPQTLLLRDQIKAMDDGGVVIITSPAYPFRCPPGPYERAGLIANYLHKNKPKSKVIILDAKDDFAKQDLFMQGWKELYPGMVEWVSFGNGGEVASVDPKSMQVKTLFDTYKADVVNVVPPQRANRIVDSAGLAGDGDWCEIDTKTFESKVVPGIHVLGDSSIAGAMPKSGFAASNQAHVCAYAVAALQAGEAPPEPTFLNVCYSFLAADYGISIVDGFKLGPDGDIVLVDGTGTVSPLDASADYRAKEADYAHGWYKSITRGMFG